MLYEIWYCAFIYKHVFECSAGEDNKTWHNQTIIYLHHATSELLATYQILRMDLLPDT